MARNLAEWLGRPTVGVRTGQCRFEPLSNRFLLDSVFKFAFDLVEMQIHWLLKETLSNYTITKYHKCIMGC